MNLFLHFFAAFSFLLTYVSKRRKAWKRSVLANASLRASSSCSVCSNERSVRQRGQQGEKQRRKESLVSRPLVEQKPFCNSGLFDSRGLAIAAFLLFTKQANECVCVSMCQCVNVSMCQCVNVHYLRACLLAGVSLCTCVCVSLCMR